MHPSTQDRTEGKIHEVKGTIKEAVGVAAGNPALEDEGKTEKIAGKIQGAIGLVEKAVGA